MSNKNIIAILLAAILILGIGLWFFLQDDQEEKLVQDEHYKGQQEEIVQSEEEDQVPSAETGIVMYYFWGEGSPICEDVKPFLDQLENDYADLEIRRLETYRNKKNSDLFKDMAAAYGSEDRGVPTFFIGDRELVGYSDRIEQDLIDKIESCLDNDCINPEDKL